jgi:hypothetical protein
VLLYDDLTQKQKDFFLKYIWNGVGSREYPKPPQLIFREASIYHDFGYFRGGPESLRKEVDREFFHKAHSAVRRLPIAQRPFYYAMSYIYFYGLKKLGSKAWELYPEPAKTWEEFLNRVYAYFDRNPGQAGRPPKWVE